MGGLRKLLGLQPGVLGEGTRHGFVTKDMRESRRLHGTGSSAGAQRLNGHSGCRQKPADFRVVGGDEGQRLERYGFRILAITHFSTH